MNSLRKPPIRAAVFDLGKVLLDFDYAIAAERLARHCNLPPQQIREALDQSGLLIQYETGNLTRNEFFDQVRETTGFNASLEEFAPLFSDIFTPIDLMIDLHAELRDRSIPTYVFSNTNDLAIEHIRKRYDFYSTFTGYVLSYEQKAIKPNPRIYQAVETQSDCRGKEILYIDDRAENIAAARDRGWLAILQAHPMETVNRVRQLGVL